MKRIGKNRAAALLGLSAMVVGSYASAARATVFEQKWVAGQRLSYDMTLSDSHLSLAGNRPSPLLPMGIPLNIDISGNGAIDLDTQSVADDGTGIVAVRVPSLQLDGAVMTFKTSLLLKDGRGRFLLNGQNMGDANGFDMSAMTSPPVALKIGKGGDVLGFVPLADAPAPTKPAKNSPFPFDLQALMQSAIGNVVPQLWPARDLKDGESWSVSPTIALPGKTAPATLGTVNLKLIGTEKTDGRDLQHVTVQGELNIDKDTAAAMAKSRPAALASVSPVTPNHVKQVVNGDIWFDAAAGQLVRSVVKVHMQSEAAGTAKSPLDEADAAPKAWTATQEFEGTVTVKLRAVSVAPEPASAPTPAPVAKTPDAKTPDAKAPAAPPADAKPVVAAPKM